MLQLGFFFLALSWLMPGHYPPWMSFQPEFVASVGACLIGAGLVQRRQLPRVSPLAIVAFLAGCIPLVQLAFGEILFHADALLATAYVAGFGLCIVAGCTLAKQDSALLLDGLAAGFVAAAFVSNGIALSQWLDVGKDLFAIDIATGGRPYGNLGQPNHLATLLTLGILGLLRWFEVRRISLFPMIFGSAWLGFGVVMTQSRAAWLTGIFIGIWYFAKARDFLFRLSTSGLAAASGTFVLGVLAWRPLNDFLLIATSTSLDERVKQNLRLVHWRTILEAVWASPWVGYGWNQVSMAQRAAADHQPMGGELLFYSHNLLLDLLAWNGIPLGGLLIAALAWWFVRQVRVCRSVDQWVLFAAVAAIFLHGMVEYPLSYAYFLLPAGLMMGALDGMDGSGRSFAWPRAAFVLSLVGCTVLVAYTGYEYMKVEEAARTVRLVSARIGTDKVASAPVPDVWLIDSQREYIRFLETQPRKGMTTEELNWMRRISSRFTYASAMYRFALAAGLNGQADEARAVLFTMCQIHGPDRCAEGREGWAEQQGLHPELAGISFPR